MPYYNDPNYINVFYNLNIAIEEYFADLLFDGDLSRIIYASNQYAFRERSRQDTKSNNLNFPFMNYRIIDLDFPSKNRKMFNNMVNIEGIYLEGTGKKVKVTPVNVVYEGIIYFERNDDNYQAYNRIIFQTSNETILYPQVTMKDINDVDVTFPISAFLDFDLKIDGKYNENDWMTQNRIHTIGMNSFSFDTVVLQQNDTAVSLTEEAILEFLSSKPNYSGELTNKNTLDPQTLITQYFTEGV